MQEKDRLKEILRRIDGRGYKAYNDIEGSYNFGDYILIVDHVQGDPFAAPSRLRVKVPQRVAGYPPDTYTDKSRRVALGDYLTRVFWEKCRGYCRGRRGTGKSGLVDIDHPGQEILERTSVVIDQSWVEVRFFVGLPAAGRRILSQEAYKILFGEIPLVVKDALLFSRNRRDELYHHIRSAQDQDLLRGKLDELGLAAFIADGSILPRASGVDDRPLTKGRVIAFQSPPFLKVEVQLPYRGKVEGMGIPKGVTLIVGGGYHGKSTLLNSIQLGVYNHIPGDGRELVATHPQGVKIRAEDGRRVEKVDISPFINNLPFGKKTDRFSSDDASGSTSQAANIMEALELGATLLLIDEDTSATNFMIRDHRMQELVAKDKEPITPFIDKVSQLFLERGVSTILVLGGSGDYFDVAHTVIMMEDYLPRDVTERAKGIASKYKAERKMEGGDFFGKVGLRVPMPDSINPSRGKREVKVDIKGLRHILFGRSLIDLSSLEQLVDASQTVAIGDVILYCRNRLMDGKRSLGEILSLMEREISNHGLDCLNSRRLGNYARPRMLEVGGAINRLRTLIVS